MVKRVSSMYGSFGTYGMSQNMGTIEHALFRIKTFNSRSQAGRPSLYDLLLDPA